MAKFQREWKLDEAKMIEAALAHGTCDLCGGGLVHTDDLFVRTLDEVFRHSSCVRTLRMQDWQDWRDACY